MEHNSKKINKTSHNRNNNNTTNTNLNVSLCSLRTITDNKSFYFNLQISAIKQNNSDFLKFSDLSSIDMEDDDGYTENKLIIQKRLEYTPIPLFECIYCANEKIVFKHFSNTMLLRKYYYNDKYVVNKINDYFDVVLVNNLITKQCKVNVVKNEQYKVFVKNKFIGKKRRCDNYNKI